MTTLNRQILAIAAILATSPAFANDALYYGNGNQLTPLTETDVRVQKEVLTISITDEGRAVVDVYYEFYNPGQNKTVTMGFESDPPYDQSDKIYKNGVNPYIKDFTVEFNGQKLAHRNAICEAGATRLKPVDFKQWKQYEETSSLQSVSNEDKFLEYSYVYYFDATFQNGINRVHHTYSYSMATGVGFNYEINYKLSPALRWANHQIDDFTLIIRADNTAKYFCIDSKAFQSSKWNILEGQAKTREKTHYDKTYTEVTLRNGAISWHKTNYRPEDELSIVSADMFIFGVNEEPLGAYYERTSSSILYYVDDYETHEPLNEPKDKEFRARVAHNLPYANRGHVFKNAKLKAYFDKLWWYMPDPNYVDDQSKFTESDKDYLNYK